MADDAEHGSAQLGIICVECACGRRSWFRSFELRFPSDRDLRGRLSCRDCGSRDIRITRPPVQVVGEPLLLDPDQVENYRVEEWDQERDQPVMLMALASSGTVALAAYERAKTESPGRWLIVRQRGRVIGNSFRESEGEDMCGRFSQHYTWREIHAFSQPLTLSGAALNLEPRYNICPTQNVGVLVSQEDGTLTYQQKRWGLVPRWWRQNLKSVPAAFNARVESISEGKAMFRDAWKRSRCIVPANGFFEWSGPKGGKQPWYISAADGGLLGFAGLCDAWRDRDTGELVESCTVITCDANRFMSQIHDRMPVILKSDDWKRYLAEPSLDLLQTAPEDVLQRWQVTPAMNDGRLDDATIIEPISNGVERA